MTRIEEQGPGINELSTSIPRKAEVETTSLLPACGLNLKLNDTDDTRMEVTNNRK